MKRSELLNIFSFWGKAEKDCPTWHPAVCHMLDVGIVARELVLVLPHHLQGRILSLFGSTGVNGLAFFAALHDIGKISPGFQMKREDLCLPLKKLGLDFPKYAESKHGKIAACCLPDLLVKELVCPEEPAVILSQVLAAHHGMFVVGDQFIDGKKIWLDIRKNIVVFLAEIFQIESLETIVIPLTSDALIFAGLLTLADWLGSSEKENHFPFQSGMPVDIVFYIADRTDRARALIRELRMDSVVTTEKAFKELFPFFPNPCQEAVLKVVSRLHHPMLVVVETPMGTGKTEAAHAAFSHLAARFSLRGMYYALPTQATGNAMFPRIKSFLEKLDLTGQAELHLVHANADLNPAYEELQLRHIEEPDGNVVASSWFTARKRGILASFGTGTIDQALMAVLKVRHFFLRLFGLSGRLLVLDEVHAYDAYMSEEINKLIGWLSYCDSSLILLSATLPQARRKKLLEAFSSDAVISDDLRYPCVIGVDSNGQIECEEVSGLEESTVTFSPFICSREEKAESIVRFLMQKLTDGGCAACILNTVSDAQAVYEAVKKNMTGISNEDLILFHSRFTLERRLKIEEDVLSRYKKGGKRPRKGIVIATQVLEQSLDVDFDVMVSDLAPIDLLLQRAGRLHRHNNPRPALMQKREIYVLMPDIFAEAPDFGGSKYVYFPDILSKTALLFSDRKVYQNRLVNLPYGVSPIIEEVYGAEDPLVAEQLQDSLNKWIEERIGTELAKLFAAREATLAEARSCLNDPFYLERLSNDNDDERMISSRLARPTVTIVIIEDDEALSVRGKDDAKRLYGKNLMTDNVHLVRHLRDQAPPDEWKDTALLRHCHPIILYKGRLDLGTRVITYDNDFGLRIFRKTEVT